MNSRRIAVAKGCLLLAAAAAIPDPGVTAVCLFFLFRLLGREWEGRP